MLWVLAAHALFVGIYTAVALIPPAARRDPRYKLGYLVATHYPGVIVRAMTNPQSFSLSGTKKSHTNFLETKWKAAPPLEDANPSHPKSRVKSWIFPLPS